jgi:hypothetical protein
MAKLINEHSEMRHDQKAQGFRAIANRVSGDSTAPVSTAAGRAIYPLTFKLSTH